MWTGCFGLCTPQRVGAATAAQIRFAATKLLVHHTAEGANIFASSLCTPCPSLPRGADTCCGMDASCPAFGGSSPFCALCHDVRSAQSVGKNDLRHTSNGAVAVFYHSQAALGHVFHTGGLVELALWERRVVLQHVCFTWGTVMRGAVTGPQIVQHSGN